MTRALSPHRRPSRPPFARLRHGLRRLLLGAAGAGMLLATILAGPAHACGNCGCDASQHGSWDSSDTTRGIIAAQHLETRWHISEEFNDWELFLIQILFMEHFLPAMMQMTQQLTAVAMKQMLILGTFFDAKQQMETQLLFQRLKAEAHKDYQPSTGMCVFGTNVRSLAAAERRAEITQAILAQRSLDRQFGHVNTVGAEGPETEKRSRLGTLTTIYCQRFDNGGQLQQLCSGASGTQSTNRDMDYTRLIDRKLTLDIDFFDGNNSEPTDDERDVFALAANLYAHDVFQRIPESLFRGNTASNRGRWLDLRAIAAKRSVAENSFNAIVGMRVQGTPEGGTPAAAIGPAQAATSIGPQGSAADTGRYMQVVLRQLGLEDNEDIIAYLGERPSYYAQMEILTKKLYQRPEFYTELYDTPTNIERKKVAMQAIALMQDFDILKSYLRQEMILAVLVELELAHEQSRIEDALANLVTEGQRQQEINNGGAAGP